MRLDWAAGRLQLVEAWVCRGRRSISRPRLRATAEEQNCGRAAEFGFPRRTQSAIL